MLLEVEPRKGQIPKKTTFEDIPLIEVPDLVGMTKRDLQEQLVDLMIDASGEGDVVVRQAPEPGTKIKEGSTIRLYFDKE